jgi:hypothetical protein
MVISRMRSAGLVALLGEVEKFPPANLEGKTDTE